MNEELYSDQFRSFKYLQASPMMLQFWKKSKEVIDHVIPNWMLHVPTSFEWPSRIEFLEQLFDAADTTIYIVKTGPLISGIGYEPSLVYTIKNPTIYTGPFPIPDFASPVTIEDFANVNLMGDDLDHCHLSPKSYVELKKNAPIQDRITFQLENIPIIPQSVKCENDCFSAIFTDEHVARMYALSLRDYVNLTFEISRSSFSK